ncbi:heme o synthase [bacterium]|nr:heme o synthase [bacterium]
MNRQFWSDLLTLTKPRICVLALAMTALGYCVGLRTPFHLGHFLISIFGTALVGAGCGAINQWMERDIDALMHRTRERPLPTGRLSGRTALIMGFSCLTVGTLVLWAFVNGITAVLGIVTFLTYLVAYTPMKRTSSLSTLMGAIPGAMPPLMGWTASFGALAPEGWVLFAILFLWQVPHFLAIAWMYREDYARAGLPILSVVDMEGGKTSKQVLLYSSVLLPLSLLPTLMGVTGQIYFFGALLLGVWFFIVSVYLAIFRTKVYARKLFFVSIIYLPLLGILMAADLLPR